MRRPNLRVKQIQFPHLFILSTPNGGDREANKILFVMYNYIVKFTYAGESYECTFPNVTLFNEEMEEEILANQAKEAANSYLDCCNLRKPDIHIGKLQLYRVIEEKLIWEKK